MSLTMSVASPDNQRRASLPHLAVPASESRSLSSTYLSKQERAAFIAASSTRRPSAHSFFHSSSALSYSPPLASNSSSSSVASSSNEKNYKKSPILTPFQWTSNLRQYIMTDIGPQPSNSQMPTLRSHSHLVRQRSCCKIRPVAGGLGAGGFYSGHCVSSITGEHDASCPGMGAAGAHMRYSTNVTDLCTILQDEVLPPMEVPSEKRFAHDEWDDEDE